MTIWPRRLRELVTPGLRRARHRETSASSRERLDLVLVVAEQCRGWILESICQQLSDHATGRTALHYLPETLDDELAPLPPAHAYFFSHYLLFLRSRHDPQLRSNVSLVLFTHPGYSPGEARRIARALRSCTAVISLSSLHARALVDAGLPARKLAVVTPGADAHRFQRHERNGKPIGLCSKFYPRKAPGMVAALVREMPHREFRLLGQRWRDAPGFANLEALPNFDYVELEYANYPSFYDGIDVFVSPSKLEGGPIPLIEAMMSNVVPVATRTGFAPDVIRHGENGFLCDVDAPVEVFAELIEAAYALGNDVRSTVEHLTWQSFARSVLDIAGSP